MCVARHQASLRAARRRGAVTAAAAPPPVASAASSLARLRSCARFTFTCVAYRCQASEQRYAEAAPYQQSRGAHEEADEHGAEEQDEGPRPHDADEDAAGIEVVLRGEGAPAVVRRRVEPLRSVHRRNCALEGARCVSHARQAAAQRGCARVPPKTAACAASLRVVRAAAAARAAWKASTPHSHRSCCGPAGGSAGVVTRQRTRRSEAERAVCAGKGRHVAHPPADGVEEGPRLVKRALAARAAELLAKLRGHRLNQRFELVHESRWRCAVRMHTQGRRVRRLSHKRLTRLAAWRTAQARRGHQSSVVLVDVHRPFVRLRFAVAESGRAQTGGLPAACGCGRALPRAARESGRRRPPAGGDARLRPRDARPHSKPAPACCA